MTHLAGLPLKRGNVPGGRRPSRAIDWSVEVTEPVDEEKVYLVDLTAAPANEVAV